MLLLVQSERKYDMKKEWGTNAEDEQRKRDEREVGEQKYHQEMNGEGEER